MPSGAYAAEAVLPVLGQAVVFCDTSLEPEHHAGTGVVLDRVVLDCPVGSRVVVDDEFVLLPPVCPKFLMVRYSMVTSVACWVKA